MTPEIIQGKLFSFQNKAHKFHLDTRNYAEHKALDGLYNGLNEFADEICEKLMGYQNGKRIGVPKLDEMAVYSPENVAALIKEGMKFAYDLYEWASEKKYCDIENIAQGLSGLFAKTNYLLTLS